jgi:HAD superfamily hydrolase (TIGR01509 family)
MKRHLETVIFDMDGTLVDSEHLWQESDRRFAESLGVVFTPEEWRGFVGMGGRAFAALIKTKLNLDISLDELAQQKDKSYMEFALGKIKPHREMVKLIKALELQGLNLAVASGSSKRVIEFTLTEAGLTRDFVEWVSADEVKNGKPKPDIFLETARRLGSKPENCLVFEDSSHGVQAALEAKMACVAIPHDYSHQSEIFQKANLLFHSMADFSAEKVLEWMDMTYCLCEECEFYQNGRCTERD